MPIGRVERITLRAGARPETGPRVVELSPVTVLVGPNNGGKSTALRDLWNFVGRSGNHPMHPWEGGTVIDAIELEGPADQDEALQFLAPQTQAISDGVVQIRTFAPGSEGGLHSIQLHLLDPASYSADEVAVRLLRPYALSLNGRERFNLAQTTQSGPLDGPPTSHWMAIERDDQLYDSLDEMVHAAFEKHLIIQTYQPPQLTPALGSDSLTGDLRHSTSPEAVEKQKQAKRLDELSDGVQVFCGLLAAVATLPHLLLLVDEPEAFLHPILSRRLGANLARIARERDARLLAATHSADFLLGCLEEVPETTVLRLDFRAEVPASHAMTAQDVAQLSRNPLLRSSDALQALFARSAVVCEADADRAFYEEINRRLAQSEGRSAALDVDFLNAQNWQTTVRLAQPLRQAGVPTAVILDLDTLAQDAIWPDLIGMGNPTLEDRDRVLNARAAARDVIIVCGSAAPGGPLRVKVKGLSALDANQRPTVEEAIRELALIGIFIVPVGELENWLQQLGCTNKQRWVTDVLTRLGTPGDPAYVPPGEGDAWAFIEAIAQWLEDPARKGMPAS